MRRRDFITLVGGAGAGAWSGFARAQQKTPRVGVLWHGADEKDEAIYLGAVQQGLSDFGYVNGKNIILVHRFAAEIPERFVSLAADSTRALYISSRGLCHGGTPKGVIATLDAAVVESLIRRCSGLQTSATKVGRATNRRLKPSPHC